VPELAVQASDVVPVDVLDGGHLRVVAAAPRALVADDFGLVEGLVLRWPRLGHLPHSRM
jgi:hypothetical protein